MRCIGKALGGFYSTFKMRFVGGVIVTDAINKRVTGTKAPLGMNFFMFCLQHVGDLGDVL